jgi:CBS domain-containing protein
VGQWCPSARARHPDEEGTQVLIEHILHRKGHEVETIPADAPVAEAIVKLREHNIGALVVTAAGAGGNDGQPSGEAGAGGAGSATGPGAVVGILSERDIVRALADADAGRGGGEGVLEQPVSALMSTDLATCVPQSSVDELMQLMTDRRIRHIPVLDGGELAGIVSIGDVVKSRIDELKAEAETLHDYISSGR